MSKNLEKAQLLPDMRRRNESGNMVRDEKMEETFAAFSRLAHQKKLSVPRTKAFSRQQVVDVFQESFELVGGLPRLASWAHENYGEFVKLYARLLPAQSLEILGGQEMQTKIVCEIQPGELDKPNTEFVDKNSSLEIVEHEDS